LPAVWAEVPLVRANLLRATDPETVDPLRARALRSDCWRVAPVLGLVLEVGALKLKRVALDGSKVKANASKHKARSYGRMEETEKRLREEVQELLKEAEAVDEEEDKRYDRERQGEELPEELQRRETRIQEAKKALEERAREKAESEGKDRKGAEPEPKAQYNFTDPESRIMKGSDGFVQGYNTQVAVEPIFQLIVGQAVTQAANETTGKAAGGGHGRTIGTKAARSAGRQRLLFRWQFGVSGGERDRGICSDGKAETR
jgi:hypothetical protein